MAAIAVHLLAWLLDRHRVDERLERKSVGVMEAYWVLARAGRSACPARPSDFFVAGVAGGRWQWLYGGWWQVNTDRRKAEPRRPRQNKRDNLTHPIGPIPIPSIAAPHHRHSPLLSTLHPLPPPLRSTPPHLVACRPCASRLQHLLLPITPSIVTASSAPPPSPSPRSYPRRRSLLHDGSSVGLPPKTQILNALVPSRARVLLATGLRARA